MSPSHAVKQINHSVDLNSTDLLFAVLLHTLVLTVILVLAYWQPLHKEEPLKRIEVMMISARQLAKLEQQAHNKPKHNRAASDKHRKQKTVKTAKAKPIVKPVIKEKRLMQAKPKLAVKEKPLIQQKPIVKAEKIIKPKARTKASAKVDENYDPFAPISSSSDRTTTHVKTRHPDLADLAGKQLSSSEKERYIAMIQAAVQDHWKVPISIGAFIDPLVEMKLLRNGDIASVRILESSGNALLDESLIRAIRAAAPFQLPAQQFEFFRVNKLRFHPLK